MSKFKQFLLWFPRTVFFLMIKGTKKHVIEHSETTKQTKKLNLKECSYSSRICMRSVFDCLFIDLVILNVLLCYGSSVRVELFWCVSVLLKIMLHERYTSNRAKSFNTLHLRDLLSKRCWVGFLFWNMIVRVIQEILLGMFVYKSKITYADLDIRQN